MKSSFFLKWLLVITFKSDPITELQYLLKYHTLELFVETQFSVWIWDSKPAGIETGSPGLIAATLSFELHSIDCSIFINIKLN